MKYNGGDKPKPKPKPKPTPKTASKSTMSTQATMIKGIASKLLTRGKK